MELRKALRKVFFILTSIVLMQSAVAQEEFSGHEVHSGVLVFTTHDLPPVARTEQADEVYYLDGADAALKALTFANPGSEAQARALASSALQSPEGKAAIDVMQRVAQGISLAWLHGIRKLPAILIGGDRVVYGIFDVGQAVALIQEDIDRER